MEKILEVKVDDNIEVVLDSRFKIKGFIQFIRLSFNDLEIKGDTYKIFYDKENVKNHRLLVQTLANLYKKHKKDEATYKKMILNFKKDVIVKIKKHEVTFDEEALYITIRKLSSGEFEINYANPNEKVYNYIKGLFLFDLLDMDKYKMVVSLNEETKKIVSALISKHTIMGYKVIFSVNEEEFKKSRSFSVEGSLKEYLNKIRNALELFGAESIYEWDNIKKEYRRLAKKYHPDLHRNKPELIRKIYEKKFRRVQESYELLEEYYKQKVTYS
ncbi:DnaJ domain-containing protein [Caminibacter pacificus]|uniref:Molecular chaperone DnaJ n=1 Tax=Caminibacter pacificus TaxID=1424653 RepID=A0AAJ4RCU3_9BACT|nr:DnaJ domain-containing protein [Caminibacter pacificus]NPA87440.1 DnaJ domain-containing protein [Campylobacterota bacterium]QCI27748.1 molecular chaperone DnaJ [Caminibacter pacificus]ROR40078.1 molecular chaperone DnaJ [Caminibacter pacificus]